MTSAPFVLLMTLGFGMTQSAFAQSHREDQEFGDKPILESVLPYQKWSPKPANVVGLLNSNKIGVCQIQWTRNVAFSAYPNEALCADEYYFNADGDSPNAVYFESKGEGENYIPNWNVGGASWNAAKFKPTTPNRFGLSKDVHLVNVQVNGGRGAEADSLHFVATDVKVLDQTAAYPIDPSLAVHTAIDRYLPTSCPVPVNAADAKLDAKMAEIKKITPGLEHYNLYNDDHSLRPVAGFAVTWLEDAKVLRVVYYRSLRETFGRKEAIYHNPHWSSHRWVDTYLETEFVEVTDFDVTGRMIEQKDLPVTGSSHVVTVTYD